MQSNDENKPDGTAEHEPYWRALDGKKKPQSTQSLRGLSNVFNLDGHSDSDSKDDVTVSIGLEDFEFIQKKMKDEFYVSPKDVIHDALFYMQLSKLEERMRLEKRNAKNPPDPSVAEFFDKAKADGTLGTPEFNKEFNRRFCDGDDLQKKLADGAEPEY